jgi:hypothetical protein
VTGIDPRTGQSLEVKHWRDSWAAWHLEQARAALAGRPMAPEFGDEPPEPPGVRHLRLLRLDDEDG